MKPAKVRASAAQILARLFKQQGSLASLLPRAADVAEDDQNQIALLRELCFGTCRWYHKLHRELDTLLDKPLKNKDIDIHCLLLVGMYQLEYMRLADHAAVNETVNATVLLKKGWAKSLVNGVLRQYQRRLASANPDSSHDDVALTYADWMVNDIRTDWPQHWSQILMAGNQHPPMTLRVNLSRVSRADYLDRLAAAGITAHAGTLADSAVYLEQGRAVAALPGFSDGLISVQDEASQLIPGLLAAGDGHRILDACAAPGGKTCHILETFSQIGAQAGGQPQTLWALDIEARRLERIEENLQRLSLAGPAVNLMAADSSEPDSWWDGEPFDRILLDAPCSATGIIRRQPDIKVLRQAADVTRLTELQHKLLARLWTCLAPGGTLLYSTCSVLRAENDRQIVRFLAETPDAVEIPINAEWGVTAAAGLTEPAYAGRQLLPSNQGADGFYFAVLRKNTP